MKSLLTPDISSHAVSEVLTKAGWLVVDSVDPWLSLDRAGRPVSMQAIGADVDRGTINWDEKLLQHMGSIYREPFVIVYGLYSRHGRFYPPFNIIPDIHYGEFLANFL